MITLEPEEWIERPGSVVLLATMKATGKGAGVPVSSPLGQVFEFAEGRIRRIRYFRTHQQALDLAVSLDASLADA